MSAAITIGELLSKIDRGARLLLVDVRNDEEYERWRVEGRQPVETFHRPYFDFLEDESLLDAVPRDRGPIFAICAKGDSSELIAEMLRDRGADARNVAGGMVAYGESLQPVQVSPDIWQFNRRGKGCLSYVVLRANEAVVVDPSRNTSAYEDFVRSRGARIIGVLDTHVHADHVSGAPKLAASIGEQRSDELLRTLPTPGHTPASRSFLVDGKYLLAGDTMFVESVGRPDLGGQVVAWGRMLFRTLTERIADLPDDTVVLPAHYASPSEIGPDGIVSARLGDLRRTVPELQIRSEEEFVESMKKAMRTPPETYEKIIRVNSGLAEIDEATASEWELGKNECAAGGRR